MGRIGRLILSGPCPPDYNMACDQALALHIGQPVLRLYQWDPPGISLGYFQTAEEVLPFASGLESAPFVRRITGGGAIYHGGELTYALISRPDAFNLPPKTADSYRYLHAPFISVLRGMGIDAVDNEPIAPERQTVCFNSITRFDVVVKGQKLIGSAQRRHREYFLQHGSLPLEKDPFAEKATSIQEEAGEYDLEELISSLTDAISTHLKIDFQKSSLTSQEEETCNRLRPDCRIPS